MADEKTCLIYLRSGIKHPYNRREPLDKYERAAVGIVDNLRDRRGIKHEFEAVDDPKTREEIITTLATIIRLAVTE